MSGSYWLFYYNINFNLLFIFQAFLKLITRSFTINTKQFTVYIKGPHWSLNFGPASVVLSVKDLDQNLTINSLKIPLAAWSLLLSHRQELLDNHLHRDPMTPNKQGKFEKRGNTLKGWSTRYRDQRIRAILSRRH